MLHERLITSAFGSYFAPKTAKQRVYEDFTFGPGLLGTYGHWKNVDISPTVWHEVQKYIKACERSGMDKLEMIKAVLIRFKDFNELKYYADVEACKLLNV